MKIERQAIAKKLKQLKSITPPKITAEVAGILLKDSVLHANNLEFAVTTPLGIETDECFIIPMKAIDLIESLPDGIIEITEKNNKVTVKSENGCSKFSTVEVADFPEMPSDGGVTEESAILNYDFETISDAINKVMYACDVNSTKQVMTGIYFESDGEFLNIVACDGYRLAWNKLPWAGNLKVVVPKLVLQKVMALGLKGSMALYQLSHNKVVFKTGEYTVYTRLLDGAYISYKSMFEEHYPVITGVDRQELLNSVARSSICAPEHTTPTVLTASENMICVSVNATLSNFTENVELLDKIDTEFKMGFNPRYLIECLKATNEDTAQISYISEVRPLIVDAGSLKSLVLPVRLKS